MNPLESGTSSLYGHLEVLVVEVDVVGQRNRLYIEPGYPGLVGSSKVPGFFDSITTTRSMLGRDCGST